MLIHLKEKDSQMACFVALAISGGARVSELLRFTMSTITEADDVFDGIFLYTATPIKSKGRGRSGQMSRKYILKDTFLPYFEKWAIDRKSLLEKRGVLEDHDFLFVKKKIKTIPSPLFLTHRGCIQPDPVTARQT